MAKGKFTSFELYAILFEQLERLNENEIKDTDLEKEIRRSQAITEVADRVIDLAKTEVSMETLKIKSTYAGGKIDGVAPNQLPQVGFFKNQDS